MYFNVIVFPFRQFFHKSLKGYLSLYSYKQSCPGVHKVRVGPLTRSVVATWFIQLIYFTVHTIRERGSVLYLGMATDVFEFTIVMYHPNNGQRSYKPQTKHAERMILPRSLQKYSRTYLWVRGSWETDRRKSRISSSSFSYKILD